MQQCKLNKINAKRNPKFRFSLDDWSAQISEENMKWSSENVYNIAVTKKFEVLWQGDLDGYSDTSFNGITGSFLRFTGDGGSLK